MAYQASAILGCTEAALYTIEPYNKATIRYKNIK